MEPHDILGLTEAEAADPTQLRRAYARLLKQHRPDRDPAGFRRLRDAYEELQLGVARDYRYADLPIAEKEVEKETEQEPEISSPSLSPLLSLTLAPDASTIPSPSPPPLLVAPQVELASRPAFRTTMESAWQKCTDAFSDQVERQASANNLIAAAIAVRSWGEDYSPHGYVRALTFLIDELGDRPEIVDEVLTDLDLLLLTEHGGEDAIATLLEQWEEGRNWARLRRFGQAAQNRLRDGFINHADSIVTIALALAMRDSALASSLIGTSYPELSPDQRRLVDHADHSIAIGRAMESWPSQLRYALVDALDDEVVPTNQAVLGPLKRFLAQTPKDSLLVQEVQQRLPALAGQIRRRLLQRERRPEVAGSGNRFLLWFGMLLFFALSRMCASATREHKPVGQQPMPIPFKIHAIPPPQRIDPTPTQLHRTSPTP